MLLSGAFSSFIYDSLVVDVDILPRYPVFLAPMNRIFIATCVLKNLSIVIVVSGNIIYKRSKES